MKAKRFSPFSTPRYYQNYSNMATPRPRRTGRQDHHEIQASTANTLEQSVLAIIKSSLTLKRSKTTIPHMNFHSDKTFHRALSLDNYHDILTQAMCRITYNLFFSKRARLRILQSGSQRGPDFPFSDHGHSNASVSFFP